jgi:Tol biopolymer transport system component
MALAAGTRLGPYEILAPLGAGGMGEVYRARDTKLGRDVALKILPDSFAQDPERVARFRREAQVLAALNHPHIAAIHGLEDSGATQFFVLELVEGETLAERLKRGALPIEKALAIAWQMADALQAAHEKNIIHRDLKPANIALTADDQVKVLDFGLAKALEEPVSAADPSLSPTLTVRATRVGVILGTAAYMSPEQARGHAVDQRADIWAFGVVLYEMVTGRQLFSGATISDTLAAVLREVPDLTPAPVSVRRLLQACLQKDPKRRLQAIGDSRLLLDDGARVAPEATSRVPWAVAAAFALVAAVALWSLWRRPASDHPQPAMQVDLDLGAAMSLNNVGPDAILSPDGGRLVFVIQDSNGRSHLVTRALDQSQSVELRGSEGAYAPFFSPDGQWVAFFAGGKLKKTRLDGGDPVILCNAPAGRGGTWVDDGDIIAALETQKGLALVPSAGGQVVMLTTLAADEISHRWPHVLPGAKTILFISNKTFSNFDESSINTFSLADGKRKIVLERGGMYPRYASSGHLIYVTRGTLFAVPFDPGRLQVLGHPTALIEDVSNDTNFGFARVDLSANGTLLYRKGRTEGQRTIHWLDNTGKLESLGLDLALYQFPRVSPDGSRLLWQQAEGSSADLWIYDWRRGSKTRLTDGKDVYTYPVWSPDGRYVVFSSSKGVFWTRADAAGKPQRLIERTETAGAQFPTSFTPDGKHLVFSELNPTGGLIQTVVLDGSSGQLRAGKPELFLQTSAALPFSAFSPDGRWLAYADAESGNYEVYVRAFPDKGTRWLISSGGGTMPAWSTNGRELFYRNDDSRIMVATYTVDGDTFIADKPRVWSDRRLANTGLTPLFDLAPDGKRFLVLMRPEAPDPNAAPSHVTLMINFFDELRRRVPQ